MNYLTKSLLAMLLCASTISYAKSMPNHSQSLVPNAISVQNSDDGIVAKVNDESILKSELIQATQQILDSYAKRNITLSHEQAQTEAMDSLIMRKLQLGLIRRIGVTPNENAINAQLLKIANAQGFNNLSQFQQALDKQQKDSYANLRNALIEEAALQALWQNQVASRIRISKQDIDSFLLSQEGKALNQDEYRTTHIRVPFSDDVNRISESERLQALQVANRLKTALTTPQDLTTIMKSARGNYPKELQGADTGYHRMADLPDELAAVITSLSVGDISQPIITPSGVDVIMLTDKRTAQAVIMPEWQVSHILVKTDTSQPPEIAEQKINELYAALQAGGDFAQLAATYSDDTASASQQGSLGWVSEDQMVAQFEAVMKQTPTGDFSLPFATQFGYHILKINDKRETDVTDLYVRRQAQEILFNREIPKAQEDWWQQLRAAAYIQIMQ